MKRPIFIVLVLFWVLMGLVEAQSRYEGLTIPELMARTYGDGEMTFVETMAVYPEFTRQLVSYTSDGLDIYGFMNVPNGTGPFPVVVLVHGYMPTRQYDTLTYTTRYADTLARAGYLVIHPNLRNHPPSDSVRGPNPFLIGYTIDVLNLMAHIRQQGGQQGVLAQADPLRTGLWGHSMGGSVVLRAIVVDTAIKVAVLYAPMSGDEYLNSERRVNFWNDRRSMADYTAPQAIIDLVSPINYLDRIQTLISVHHGDKDTEVPPVWSQDLCNRLIQLGKPVACFTYEGQNHILQGASDIQFEERVIFFLDTFLRP